MHLVQSPLRVWEYKLDPNVCLLIILPKIYFKYWAREIGIGLLTKAKLDESKLSPVIRQKNREIKGCLLTRIVRVTESSSKRVAKQSKILSGEKENYSSNGVACIGKVPVIERQISLRFSQKNKKIIRVMELLVQGKFEQQRDKIV